MSPERLVNQVESGGSGVRALKMTVMVLTILTVLVTAVKSYWIDGYIIDENKKQIGKLVPKVQKHEICLGEYRKDIEYLTKLVEKIDRKIDRGGALGLTS